MYVKPISARFVRGKSIPAMRAIAFLPYRRNSGIETYKSAGSPRRPTTLEFRVSSFGFRMSSLALFVLGIFTDHPHDAPALHNLAFGAYLAH
jgi:hypothetical protein